MRGVVAALIVGYVICAALYAYLHMRITDDGDPAIATIYSVIWPMFLPFLLILAAANFGGRR